MAQPFQISVTIALALALVSVSAAQKEARARLKDGQSFRFKQTVVQKQSFKLGDMPMESKSKVTHEYRVTVGKKRGLTELTVLIDRIHGIEDIPMFGKKAFDSARKKNIYNRKLLATVGKSFKIFLDETGAIHSVKGFASLCKQAYSSRMLGRESSFKLDDKTLVAYWRHLFPGLPQKKRRNYRLNELARVDGSFLPTMGVLSIDPAKNGEIHFEKRGNLIVDAPAKPVETDEADGADTVLLRDFKLGKNEYLGSLQLSAIDALPIAATTTCKGKFKATVGDQEMSVTVDVRFETKTSFERVPLKKNNKKE